MANVNWGRIPAVAEVTRNRHFEFRAFPRLRGFSVEGETAVAAGERLLREKRLVRARLSFYDSAD
jgi:hypothetical protein